MIIWRPTIGLILGAGISLLSADPARAQNSQALISGLQSQIAQGEQTLRNESYLEGFCGQLRDGKHFFHRGRHRQKRPDVVVELQAWKAYLESAVAARTVTSAGVLVTREVAQAEWNSALRRRDEVVTACTLDTLRADLAKARVAAMPASGTAAAQMAWNDGTDGNRVLTVTGTLTGSFSTWQLTGTGVPSWNGQLRAAVQCTGSTSPGYAPKLGSNGTMKCYAEWKDQGKSNIWNCQGTGVLGAVWSVGDWWFGMYPFPGSQLGCKGTITAGDGKARSNMFGMVGIKSRLGVP